MQSETKLSGQDTKTVVTIIDDDQPGFIAFKETKKIRHLATEPKCQVKIVRTKGTDGVVTV